MRSSAQKSWSTSARIRRRCRRSMTSSRPQLLPTTPFSQSQKLLLGLDNGKIRACPSVNPGCVSTNPQSPSFSFRWVIPEKESGNAIQRLRDAIGKTQKNARIKVDEDTSNGNGMLLGRRTTVSEMLPVDINSHPLSLSAGLGHSLVLCKISSQGDAEVSTGVFSWGWNRSSQLGRQGLEDVPAIVKGLEGERTIFVSAGHVHSLALTSKGEVWSWGSGWNDRLGLGSSLDEPEPTLVECLEGMEVLQAVAGFDHNLLLVAE